MSGEVAGLASAVIAGFALLLSAIVAGALPGRPRAYIRFAVALGGALVVADGVAAALGGDDLQLVAGAIRLLVAALGPAMLALAVLRRIHGAALPSLALAAACLAGLIAAMTGAMLYAFAPLAVAAIVLGVVAAGELRRSALLMGLGAGALLAGAAAMSSGADGGIGFALFYAVGQLGIALALVRRSDAAVERERRARARAAFVGRQG